ncbi:MAG: T9SS type A sorting domain-containing protein [Bacteroidales bacterium]|nr:T9SS type A sorting domain-containing protein [Bacteroidales bacterium]
MKKIYTSILMLFSLTFLLNAQSWDVYDADEVPNLSVFAFEESNVDGDPATNTIIADPDIVDNNLLELISPGEDPSKFMWKYNFPNDLNDPVTLVIRMKGVSDTLDRIMELDFRQAGFRERIYIKSDNTFELKESDIEGDLPDGALAMEWHIYRLTKSGDVVNFYFDENPEPVATVTTTTTETTNNYFRFGDGNGSSTLGGLIDWIIWDTTGTYAPGTGAEIPDSLSQEVHVNMWSVYPANLTPDLSIFEFSESNVDGTNQHTNSILADPDNPGNNLLELISPEADPGKFMWKYDLPNDLNDPITLVARVKGLSDTLDRTMEFDFRQAGFRERLYIKNDNTYELNEADIEGSLPGNPLAWHIYRITKDADQVSFYIDENPEPVATVITTTTETTNNYFRIGDGNGSSTLGVLVDWVIWDTTGANAPDEGMPIPDSLLKDVQQWIVYAANETPDVSEFEFSESNVDGTGQHTNTIIVDPDNEENNLLELISPEEDPGKFMWKYDLPNDLNDPITLVARVKGLSDTLDRTMEFDFRQSGFRERLYIKNDNTFELNEADVSGDLGAGTMGWHIYRITKNADVVSFYLDENPDPVATGTTTTTETTNNYFRIGDGNGSSTLGALVDWIIWDTTAAMPPDMAPVIPDSLIKITTASIATLAELTPGVGTLVPDFAPDSTTYSLVVPSETESVTFTATATDTENAGVTGDIVFSDIPGTAVITVTAEDGYSIDYSVNITVEPVGLSNHVSNNIRIYPNPADNFVTIEINGELSNIQIFDVTGNVISEMYTTKNAVILDARSFSKGIYLIRISTGMESIVKRLIIE